MTHRDYSHTVSFLTGHGVNGAPDIDWNRFADDRQTLALYMARSNAAETTHNLISSGLSPHTPVAAVADAGGVQEQIERGVLHELPILVERLPSDLPTVIMIGRVLQEVDSWQDSTSLDQPIRAVA
jgi:siroheme synthase